MCLASTSWKLRRKEGTSGRRDNKPFFSLPPLGTRTELFGRRLLEGLTNETLFRTKNLTNFAEKNAYFKKSEKMILTENQCYNQYKNCAILQENSSRGKPFCWLNLVGIEYFVSKFACLSQSQSIYVVFCLFYQDPSVFKLVL